MKAPNIKNKYSKNPIKRWIYKIQRVNAIEYLFDCTESTPLIAKHSDWDGNLNDYMAIYMFLDSYNMTGKYIEGSTIPLYGRKEGYITDFLLIERKNECIEIHITTLSESGNLSTTFTVFDIDKDRPMEIEISDGQKTHHYIVKEDDIIEYKQYTPDDDINKIGPACAYIVLISCMIRIYSDMLEELIYDDRRNNQKNLLE